MAQREGEDLAPNLGIGLASGGGAWGRADFLLARTGGDFNVPIRTSALVCLTNTQGMIHADTVQFGMAKKYPYCYRWRAIGAIKQTVLYGQDHAAHGYLEAFPVMGCLQRKPGIFS